MPPTKPMNSGRSKNPVSAKSWPVAPSGFQLISRKYAEAAHGWLTPGYSVQLEFAGRSAYFQLGTSHEIAAMDRALEIQSTLVRDGWSETSRRFPQEFVCAIFWLERPIACTYSTLFTSIPKAFAPLRKVEGARSILLIEPDESIREALICWINRQPGCSVVQAVSTPSEVASDKAFAGIDIILFNRFLQDASMPEFHRRIASTNLVTHAFSYGIFSESDDIFKSISGVSEGYYLRRRLPDDFFDPLVGAWGGTPPSPTQLNRHLRDYFQRLFQPPSTGAAGAAVQRRFTYREQQILHGLQQGLPDKEIARNLNISPLTVHTHLKHIFEKLDAHSRTEAVMKYLQK